MTTPANPTLPDVVEGIVTAEDADWLAGFTRSLVEDRLVAYGHNITPIRAIYRWDGAVHDDHQARVGRHTLASLVPAIVERANRDHPDDVPCVVAVPIVGGHPATSNGSQTRRRPKARDLTRLQAARSKSSSLVQGGA